MTKPTNPAQAFDPAKRYTVQLKRSVKLGPITHYPREQQIMTGKLINRIIEQEGRDVIVNADLRD